jgi:hypothetical protein
MITLQRFLSNRRRVQAELDLKRRRKLAPIVTEDGLAVHQVLHLWEGDVALTKCGMRVADAAGLIRTARSLTRTPTCKNCDRTERKNP